MKILNGIADYEVTEANFESSRLALNFIGEYYPADYFHGIAGTAFRIGGICPCAPTCTTAMHLRDLLELFGYECEECAYDDNDKDASLTKLTAAVRASIDAGIPAIVWNAFTACEFDIVTGYDENEQVFFGRGSHIGNTGDYAKMKWDYSLENAGLVGLTALIIKRGSGFFDKKGAEISAVKEAIRHANDMENADKASGGEWVFLQGKAAYNRWADDFSKRDHKRGLGDAYCIGIYASCHALAGPFIRRIADGYPNVSGILAKAVAYFDKEAEALTQSAPLLGWNSPETSAERNAKAAVLLREAAKHYGTAIDLLAEAAEDMRPYAE